MTRNRDEEGLLSRWSRLKRERPAAPDPSPAQTLPEPPDDIAEIESETEILERLDLPAPESLAPGDDFSRFMAPDVPAFLRRRALRVLWRTNPDFAVLDGLVDYGEDYRGGGLVEAVQTAYQVGRGFLKQEEEATADQAEAEAAGEPEAPPPPEPVAVRPPETVDATAQSRAEAPESPAATDEAPKPPAENRQEALHEDAPLPPPRRMVFVSDS